MRAAIFLVLAVVATLSVSATLAWPSWTTALVLLGAFFLCFWFGPPRPKPFWWFPGATLLVVGVTTFAFNLCITVRREKRWSTAG